MERAAAVAKKIVSVEQVERSQMISTQCECRMVLFYLSSEDREANSFHSSKDLDNWSFVLRLTPDESWLLTRGEACQIVY